ncbi:M16 family metallopeptidase [Chryseolinea lacunae]|uniref:Insulinase family protein n=1 Tax=Chryseolinea lacunae TaxID=2801331 RepID=A0ABS1KT18_9BACT|nr:pitrilysin family protein [Chryseolinea lacunae]MBL0742412.1 insulinase family protein [Chryseolinea lacunae]
MLDRTLAPPFNRSTEFELLHPEKIVLSGGAEAWFVLGGSQDVSKVELIFPAGRWVEKVWGASYFASQLLSKGTKTKGSFEIAQRFDSLGAHLEVNAALDIVSVALYSINKNLEAGLRLVMELLTASIFPEKELEQIKAIYLQNLKVNREKTSFQASTLIRKNVFGDAHPYGKELDDAEVTALTQEHLVDHFQRFFTSCTLIVSGKVTPAHQQLIADVFAPFGVNTLEKNKTGNYSPAQSFRQVVEKEGSVQATIRMGKKFITRTHPDYADTVFLNHILGGYFGSRLMKNIREDKGLSYGISSSLHALRHDSYLMVGADVNRENLTLTFDEIGKELKRLRTEAVDAEELETARNHFIGSLQSEITTSFAHADKIKNILLYNLSDRHYQNMIHRVDAITAEDLLKTAATYFREDSFIEVAVG